MIVFKKIEFLRPLFLHAATLMRFSEQAKQEWLSASAQKAVWATSIINTISTAALPTSLRDPTLRKVILNLPDPSKEFYFDGAEKQEVMKLFTKGIELASPFLAQPKIQSALQKYYSHQIQGYVPKQFLFYPNSSVTTPMFKQLMKASTEYQTNFLLVGGSGISKTASIILYIHLSYHQTRFIYEASKDNKIKQELAKLIKLKLVPDQVVKYWYWSTYKNTNKQIKKLILEQAVELEPAVHQELMQQPYLSEFIKKLRTYYNIPCLLQRPIVDQVNNIAQLMRKTNQNLKQLKYTPNPESQAIQLYQSLKTFLLLGSYYTLASSETISRKMLERGDKELLCMDLVDSQRGLQTIHIPYEKTVLTKAGEFDFWQTFWFEIERCGYLSYDKFQSAKQTFYTSIESRKLSKVGKLKKSTLSAFFCFANIREFVSKNNQNLKEALLFQDYQTIQEMIKDFHSYSLQESKQKLLTFLQKGDAKYKKQILLNLFLIANQLKQNDNYRQQPFLLQVADLDQILKEETFTHKWPWTLRMQKEDARNDIKSLLVLQTEKFVQFIFTVEEFTLLAAEIMRKGQFKYFDFLKALMSKKTRLSFGIGTTDGELTPESYLVSCLTEKSGLSFNATQKPSNIQAGKHFQIYKVEPFNKLRKIKTAPKAQQAQQGEQDQQNQNKQSYQQDEQDEQGEYDPQDKYRSFEQHFQSAVQIAINNPREDILALPYVIKDGLRIRSASQNPTVDFAILRYNDLLNIFQIMSFDVTVSSDLTQKMLQARILFTKLFEGVKSIKGIPFSLTHTYLSPKDATYQQQEINNAPPLAIPLTIQFADISKLTITTESFWNLHMFKHVIDLTKREERKKKYIALLLKCNKN